MDDLHRRVERGYDAIARRYADVARANRGPETYSARSSNGSSSAYLRAAMSSTSVAARV